MLLSWLRRLNPTPHRRRCLALGAVLALPLIILALMLTPDYAHKRLIDFEVFYTGCFSALAGVAVLSYEALRRWRD